MKKFVFSTIFIFLTLLVLQTYAQTLEFSWAKKAGGRYVESGNAITTDVNGNILVCGSFISDSLTFDNITLGKSDSTSSAMFIAKYNPDGQILWAKTATTPSSSKTTYGYAVKTDSNGNIFVAGDLWGDTISFDDNMITLPNGIQNASFLVKYTPDGDFVWAKMALNGRATYSLAIDNNDDLIITGKFHNAVEFDGYELTTGAGGQFLAKYSNSGNFIWADITSLSISSYGFNSEWDPDAVYADDANNVYMTGWSGTDTTFFNTEKSIYVTNNPSLRNFFLAKYNSDGEALWAKGADRVVTQGISVAVNAKSIITSGDYVYVTGRFTGDSLRFGNNLVVCNNYQDMFIAKFDGSGNNIWAKSLGSEGNDYGNSLALDTEGNIYLCGTIESSQIHYDNTPVGTSTGGNHASIFKIAQDGTFSEYIQSENIPFYGISFGNAITLDTFDNILMTGSFSNSVAFGNDTLTSITNWDDIFVTKLFHNIDVATNSGKPVLRNFSLYPNPASDFVLLSLPEVSSKELEIKIYNLTGSLVKKELLFVNQKKIDIGELANGIYVLTLNSDDLVETHKFIIQR